MKIDCVADVSGGHWTENGNSKSGRNIMSSGYAYILCNDRKNVLYTGSTLDLKKRVNHHKNVIRRWIYKKIQRLQFNLL